MIATIMDDRDLRPASAAIPRDAPGHSAGAPPGETDTCAAFSAFYRQFVPTLVAFLMWQGARLPDAADIAQDTMIKAYERWSTIERPESWARRVASRALVRRIASVIEDCIDSPPEHSSLLPTLSNVEVWEQRHEVLRLLDRLPPRQRQVLAWALDGYTPGEIAAELDLTPEAVRANLMKARRALAEYLGTIGGER